MSQTSYARDFTAAFAGMEGEGGSRKASYANGESANIPAGILVKVYAEGVAKLPDSATARLAGAVLNNFAREPGNPATTLSGTDAVVPHATFPTLTEGAVWLQSEESLAVTDDVYVRFATNGTGKLQLGAIRNDPDGVAQVTTVTVAASQNSTLFGLRIKFADESYAFQVVSDSDMTATEVDDAFRVAMAANALFTARVVATGTSTLILTGQVAGEAFTVQNDGTGTYTSITTGTPPAAHCRRVKGARILKASTSTAPCLVYLSVAADTAQL